MQVAWAGSNASGVDGVIMQGRTSPWWSESEGFEFGVFNRREMGLQINEDKITTLNDPK